MKAKLAVKTSILAGRLDENSVLSTNLGFTPHWDYEQNYKSVGEANENTIQKFNLNRFAILDNKHLKSDCTNGSGVNGLLQPILFSFLLTKSTVYKKTCKPERMYYKKTNKSSLNTKLFFLENDDDKEVNFNEETLTINWQIVKI